MSSSPSRCRCTLTSYCLSPSFPPSNLPSFPPSPSLSLSLPPLQSDLVAGPQLDYYTRGIADHVPANVLDAYPALVNYLADVHAEPRVAKYYAAEKQ